MNKISNYPLPSYIKLKGRAKIELFDAESGKLIHSDEGENAVLSYPFDVWFKEAQRQKIACNQTANSGNFTASFDATDQSIPNLCNSGSQFNYLVLSTSDDPVSTPEDEYTWPGDVTGYCDLYNNSDTNVFRGSINPSLSYFDEKGFHYVFDFGSLKANGWIKSVCWMYFTPSATYKYATTHQLPQKLFDVVRDADLGKSTINDAALDPIKYYGGTPGGSDGYYYGRKYENSRSQIYKFRLDGLYAAPAPTQIGDTSHIYDFVVVGDYIVYANANNNGVVGLHKISTAQASTLNLNLPLGTFTGKCYNLGTDGTDLFAIEYGNSVATCKVLKTNLATDLTFAASPSVSVLAIAPTVKTFAPSFAADSSFYHFMQNGNGSVVLKTVAGVWDGDIYFSTTIKNEITGAIYGTECSTYRTVRLEWNTNIAYDLRKTWHPNKDYFTRHVFLGPEEKLYISSVAVNRTNIYRFNPNKHNANLMARKLCTPVEKTSSNTMRVTYDIEFADTQDTTGWE